jgi:hypothetical protein
MGQEKGSKKMYRQDQESIVQAGGRKGKAIEVVDRRKVDN